MFAFLPPSSAGAATIFHFVADDVEFCERPQNLQLMGGGLGTVASTASALSLSSIATSHRPQHGSAA